MHPKELNGLSGSGKADARVGEYHETQSDQNYGDYGFGIHGITPI
jgi:hypothetical protein